MDSECVSRMADTAGVGSGSVSTRTQTQHTAASLSSDDVPYDDMKTAANTGQQTPAFSALQQQSSNNNVASLDALTMSVTNEEEEASSGNVLLPAAEPATIPSSVTAQPHAAENLPLILCSLSIDSLHCIASFLPPTDWSNFGQANHATNRVCNQVFRRVRMHGFRCATEVISAWVSSTKWSHILIVLLLSECTHICSRFTTCFQKLGQHADARELSALYTKTGVPIYPYSLGHSYHTLTWRMGIEAREMENSNMETPEGGATEASQSNDGNCPVDRFYTERYDARLNDGFSSPDVTYMEEKSLFWFQQETESGNPGRNSRSFDGRTLIIPRPPVLPGQHPPGGGGIGVPVRFPDFRPVASDQSLDAQRQSSSSFVDLQPAPSRKPVIRVHRHLVDQHMLGRPCVDDENGAMRTAPVSLSADFYHPYIARRLSSSSIESIKSSEGHRERAKASEVFSPSASSSERVVPPIPTPPPSNEGTPAFTPRRDANGVTNATDNAVAQIDASEPSLETTPTLRTPTQLVPPLLVPPPLQVNRSPPPETPVRVDHPVLSNVHMEIYSSASAAPSQISGPNDGINDMFSQLSTRFVSYQRRLDLLLIERDSEGFEECLLDFWDEFLPSTANIHFYDRYTAVPRVLCLDKFLTKPCPKAIGIVQCEIERIKVHPKKKGVNMKGRLFPSYEYRLFIRDRRHSSIVDTATRNPSGEPRRDTVLMTAKNKGKKVNDVGEISYSSSKKGVNNYYLFTPQQSDIDAHYKSVNEVDNANVKRPNGTSYMRASTSGRSQNGLLGRLQSNFIGTEFQIFKQSEQKQPMRPCHSFSVPYSDSENEFDYDSAVSSDTLSTSSRSRRGRSQKSMKSLRRRNADSAYGQPQPIDEDLPTRPVTPKKRRSLRRAVSLPVMPARSSRTSRRAIAHSIEPVERQPLQYATSEEEEGVITYTANLLGNRPRIMDVCIPKVSPDGVAGAEWKRYLNSCDDANESGSSNKMLTCFKQAQTRTENPTQANPDDDSVSPDGEDYVPPDDFGLLALQNRPPWWNIELGAFVLNFGGRVSVASVKNFQLCDRNDQDYIMLQFGRIQGRHSFTMDFQHPLTAVQAFAIAISSLQSKISFG